MSLSTSYLHGRMLYLCRRVLGKVARVSRLAYLQEFFRPLALKLMRPHDLPVPLVTTKIADDDHFRAVWDEGTSARARHLLARVTAVADTLNLPIFLYWGSLLGHVREGRILPWDDDLDLAIFQPAKVAALRAALLENGLRLHDHASGLDVWIKVFDPDYPITSDYAWSYPFIDIFLYDFQEAEADRIFPHPGLSKASIFPGRRIVFEGAACFEPNRPLGILDRHYPGWRNTELTAAWDHRNECANEVIHKRSIRVDWRGRKRSLSSR